MHGPVGWRSPGVTSQPSMLLFLPYGAGALAMARHKETMPDASEEVWQERLRGEQVWVLGLNYEGALSGDRSSDNLPNCRLRPVNRRERVPGRDSPRLPIQETPHCNEGFDDAKIVSATYGAAASTANAWTEVLQVDGDVLDRLQMLHGRRLWYGSRDPPPWPGCRCCKVAGCEAASCTSKAVRSQHVIQGGGIDMTGPDPRSRTTKRLWETSRENPPRTHRIP